LLNFLTTKLLSTRTQMKLRKDQQQQQNIE
jgi:hypothetical protein